LAPEELAELPVFPLPRVVFFPGTMLPLHLFEPRYQRMIEDCMTVGPRAMAVTLLARGWEDDYEGRPPVHPVAGAGRIVAHEQLDDGTHQILLAGVCRVELDELPMGGKPYRRAAATVLPDQGGVTPGDVRALMSCAGAVASIVRRQHEDFALGVTMEDAPGRIADTITDRLVALPTTRQRILETLPVDERVRLATEAVGALMVSLSEGVDN
jgi:Lon protease-like protein